MLFFLPQRPLILTVPSPYLEVTFSHIRGGSGKKRDILQEFASASGTLFNELFFFSPMKKRVQIVLNINNHNDCMIVPKPQWRARPQVQDVAVLLGAHWHPRSLWQTS